MFKNKYRIIKDRFLGFETQVKYWFFPFMWKSINYNGFSNNTSSNVFDAEKIIKQHKQGDYNTIRVVRYIG